MAELQLSARDYPGAHYALATELLFAGQLDETITHAKEFIRQLPDDSAVVPARELLALALGSKGDLDGAAEQFSLILQRAPQHPRAQVSLGDIRLRQRRLDEAIGHYESGLKLQATDPILLGKLGLALAQAGRMGEATQALERAVSGRPADVGLVNMLGQALAAQGRYTDALAYLRRVVQLLPGDDQAARNLAAVERLAAK
jgi:Flp pilus assembly protein TadD